MVRSFKRKRVIQLLLVGTLFYAALWSVGFYRIRSFEGRLREEHRQRGEEVERFVAQLLIGDPVERVAEFPYAVKGAGETEFVIWHYAFIEETASASNRVAVIFRIRTKAGRITSVKKSLQSSHTDKFGGSWVYYPRAAFVGQELADDCF